LGYPFKLPPDIACFARLVIYRPPPAVSGTASAPLPLWVPSQCLLGDIAISFPEGVPNPTPLLPSYLNVDPSCSVVVHSSSFVMTSGQWMPIMDLRHLKFVIDMSNNWTLHHTIQGVIAQFISNQPCASSLSDFEITPAISHSIALHLVQLPLLY